MVEGMGFGSKNDALDKFGFSGRLKSRWKDRCLALNFDRVKKGVAVQGHGLKDPDRMPIANPQE